MFPSKYICAEDLKGREVTLTITHVEVADLVLVGGKTARKPVLSFAKTEKKFVCNPTNAKSIASLHGREARQWVGKQITLYPTTTKFGRDTVSCVRIRGAGQDG